MKSRSDSAIERDLRSLPPGHRAVINALVCIEREARRSPTLRMTVWLYSLLLRTDFYSSRPAMRRLLDDIANGFGNDVLIVHRAKFRRLP